MSKNSYNLYSIDGNLGISIRTGTYSYFLQVNICKVITRLIFDSNKGLL